MKMNKVAALALVMMIFLSVFVSLSLVSAAYTVEEHYMPPEPDDLGPVCAMKTRTDGYFYVPNVATDLLKIEMLFNNSHIEGDQAGGTSPYSTIQAWPDGKVDLTDVLFIANCYGTTEGMANWNYMSDIVPDGKCDLSDYLTVANNFGATGTYITDLSEITISFNIGGSKSPDSYGFVVIPSGATGFTVKRNGTPIGAMVIFYGPREPPIAYSTTFDFTVPAYTGGDVGKEVWYYILARVYVPSELSGQIFYFVATADYRVQNVKMNSHSKTGSGSSVNIDLGKLGEGYHLLEFEFVDVSGGGSLSFHVATAASQYAWLSRFRTYVPNYSDTKYEYTVKTRTYFPGDTFFLGGYADDFIDDVYIDVGLIWQDWEWDMGPSYGAIYAWGDGFMYPLNWQYDWHDITFTFGEINSTGLLDFQYISWTNQKDKIGKPKFCSTVSFDPNNFEKNIPYFFNESLRIYSATFYGGSQWKDFEHPEISERNFETRLRINTFWNRTIWPSGPLYYFDTCIEVGLGKGWAEWVLSGGTTDDVGITMNLTCLYFDTNVESEGLSQWCVTLENITLDVYSCPWIEIPTVENYPEGESIVKTDWTVATDYLGTVIMFVSSILAPEIGLTSAILGSLVGLGIKGASAATRYTTGQKLEVFQETILELHHRQLKYNNYVDDDGKDVYGPLKIFAPDRNPMSSDNDVVFFKIDPVSGKRCGLTKVVLKGQLVACFLNQAFPELWRVPLGEIEIAVYIPWFIWE